MARFIDLSFEPRPADRWRATLEWCAVVTFVLATALLSLYSIDQNYTQTLATTDFVPAYCGGQLARAGEDPYAAVPLRACEHRVAWDRDAYRPPPQTIASVPLAGYALAIFSVMSLADYDAAAILWDIALVAMTLATIWTLHALGGVRPLVVTAAVLGSEVVAGLLWGQLVQIAVLGAALAALFLVRNRPTAAGGAALLALAVPSLGLPLAIALAVWVPQTRRIVLGGLATLALFSLVYPGFAHTFEYVLRALPTQAAADVTYRPQLSFAWFSYLLGFDERSALRLATFEYLLAVTAGIALARRMAQALKTPAALVLFPLAMASLGGVDLHEAGLAAAVPFALLLAARAPELGALRWIILTLLAVPWQTIQTVASPGLDLTFGALAIALIIAGPMRNLPWLGRARVAFIAVAIYLVFPTLVQRADAGDVLRVPASVAAFTARGFDPALAATQFGVFVRSQPVLSAVKAPAALVKAPGWAGLLLLFGGIVVMLLVPMTGRRPFRELVR